MGSAAGPLGPFVSALYRNQNRQSHAQPRSMAGSLRPSDTRSVCLTEGVVMVRRAIVLSLLAVMLLSACTTPDVLQPTEQSNQTATAGLPSDTTPGATSEIPAGPTPLAGDGPWAVTFPSSDGIQLAGFVYGQGASCLVLAP